MMRDAKLVRPNCNDVWHRLTDISRYKSTAGLKKSKEMLPQRYEAE
jgi:hypothetical protein